ncbi:hypothetical protein DUT91_22225 [Phyllobacterium salinisoli]|uniref:Uncharacterized protein n=1 Tax=Phyllobacterium salinisoli TaxID=1899321 RepID=A0A368JZS4_9HYPH|nr:hypothetical protein DUT91_22225 [Phyllobacterium salinisoli]
MILLDSDSWTATEPRQVSETKVIDPTITRSFAMGWRCWATKGVFPDRLDCQIETDRERIDEILLRRHAGTRGGVGCNSWTDRMTATFVEWTGKGSGVNVADEIEKRLEAAGMLPAKKIPWSTVNRLLSSEGLRDRVGISVSRSKFQLTHPESLVLPIFRRIAEDLTNRTVVLGDPCA